MEFAIWVLITLVTLALVGFLFAPMMLLGVLDLKVPAALRRALDRPWTWRSNGPRIGSATGKRG